MQLEVLQFRRPEKLPIRPRRSASRRGFRGSLYLEPVVRIRPNDSFCLEAPWENCARSAVPMLVALARRHHACFFCSSNSKIKLGWSTRWTCGRGFCERWRLSTDVEPANADLADESIEVSSSPTTRLVARSTEQFDESCFQGASDSPEQPERLQKLRDPNASATLWCCAKISSAGGERRNGPLMLITSGSARLLWTTPVPHHR